MKGEIWLMESISDVHWYALVLHWFASCCIRFAFIELH